MKQRREKKPHFDHGPRPSTSRGSLEDEQGNMFPELLSGIHKNTMRKSFPACRKSRQTGKAEGHPPAA